MYKHEYANEVKRDWLLDHCKTIKFSQIRPWRKIFLVCSNPSEATTNVNFLMKWFLKYFSFGNISHKFDISKSGYKRHLRYCSVTSAKHIS